MLALLLAAVAITPAGVGDVQLGDSYRSVRDAGLVGKTRPGCELADPRQRIARLRSPLKGFATLNRKRRITNVYVTGGAAARGVEVRDRLREVRRKYPDVRVDRSTAPVFGVWIAAVPAGIEFAVDANTRRVDSIGVPRIPFCE